MRVLFTLVGPHAHAPRRMTEGAAGWDLAANLPAASARIEPGAWLAIPTGVRIAIPPGFEGQVRPRSGRARNHGVTVLNSPGTVDSDYRGEIEVLLINHGPKAVEIGHGERIAQLVIAPALTPELVEAYDLDDVPSARGSAGFGSTGSGAEDTAPQRCACMDGTGHCSPPALEDDVGVLRCILCDRAVGRCPDATGRCPDDARGPIYPVRRR